MAGASFKSEEIAQVDEDKLNMGIRKFLKVVGVTSQREIEDAVRAARAAGKLAEGSRLRAQMTLRIEAVNLVHTIENDIDL